MSEHDKLYCQKYSLCCFHTASTLLGRLSCPLINGRGCGQDSSMSLWTFMETHYMTCSTHCSWANLKATVSLELCSNWLCRKFRPLCTTDPTLWFVLSWKQPQKCLEHLNLMICMGDWILLAVYCIFWYLSRGICSFGEPPVPAEAAGIISIKGNHAKQNVWGLSDNH